MQRLHFSLDIDAPRETVWKNLWDDAAYREWTRVFTEGSHAKSDWKEGSRIEFLDAKGSGMFAVIDKLVPNEFMSFKHMGETNNGKDTPFPAGATGFENYTLTGDGGRTTLAVDLDAPEEYKEMFDNTFPKALEKVKALSESR